MLLHHFLTRLTKPVMFSSKPARVLAHVCITKGDIQPCVMNSAVSVNCALVLSVTIQFKR